jgi:hypothetical protein
MNPCRLFLTHLKSMPLEKLLARILPHGEIWPLKITGKIRFSPKDAPEASLQRLHANPL